MIGSYFIISQEIANQKQIDSNFNEQAKILLRMNRCLIIFAALVVN